MVAWLLSHQNHPLAMYGSALLVLLGPTAAWQAEKLFGPESALIPVLWLGMLAVIWVRCSWPLLYTWMAGVAAAMALIVLDVAVRLGL